MNLKFGYLIKINKHKIILVISLLSFLLLTIIVGKIYGLFKFTILIPLSVVMGLGYFSLFRGVFVVKNYISFLLIAGFLGFFINTIIFFILGILGATFTSEFFIALILLSTFLSICIFFATFKEKWLRFYTDKTNFEFVDFIFFILLLLISFLLIKICFENYFTNWDSFTHWAIDTKYIFQHKELRDSSFDLIRYSYLPFYPLMLSYTYFLYGRIVEQYSSLVTLFFSLWGVFVLFSIVIDVKKNSIFKSLLYVFSMLPIFSFYNIQNLLLTQYADVFCSTIILMYGIILFKKPISPAKYWKRVLLLFLLAFSIFFTKTHYFSITLFLLFFVFVYDIQFILKNFPKILNIKIFITGLLLISLFLIVNSYAQQFLNKNSVLVETSGKLFFISRAQVLYLVEMFKYLTRELSLFFAFSFSFFILFLRNERFYIYKNLFKFLFAILILSFPLFYYFIHMGTFVDMSLLRYLSLSFFLIPLLFIKIVEPFKIEVGKLLKIFIVALFCCIPLSFYIGVLFNTRLSFNPHNGEYKDFIWQKDFNNFAEKVISITGDKSKIIIVDKEYEFLSNMDVPVIYIRYYMSENSVGHGYRVLPNSWYEYMNAFSPDYFLIYSYDNYWVGCNEYLKEGYSYLVKNEKINNYEFEKSCFIPLENIIPL